MPPLIRFILIPASLSVSIVATAARAATLKEKRALCRTAAPDAVQECIDDLHHCWRGQVYNVIILCLNTAWSSILLANYIRP